MLGTIGPVSAGVECLLQACSTVGEIIQGSMPFRIEDLHKMLPVDSFFPNDLVSRLCHV